MLRNSRRSIAHPRGPRSSGLRLGAPRRSADGRCAVIRECGAQQPSSRRRTLHWNSVRLSIRCVKPKIWPRAVARSSEVHQLATLASQRAALSQQVARTRSDEAALLAQRKAAEAQLSADVSRRQAESAQLQRAAPGAIVGASLGAPR